jgi:GAF domain-containing protein
LRFPAEDAGRSLADVAQRDLDAALQLLTDRAQYITGASGAAIALKRNGMNDMLCRASTGENAPELGALLSTEYGLSGESVRTRRALRCDDAEQDARVNREVCRQLGIASVVVMPVVHDDEVLGVFELFSGKANAFGERDLSAVQRLTEMVQTAVRLAKAAEELLPTLSTVQASSAADVAEAAAVEEDILSDDVLEVETEVEAISAPVQVQEPAPVAEPVDADPVLAEPVLAEPIVAEPVAAEPVLAEAVTAAEPSAEPAVQPSVAAKPEVAPVEVPKVELPAPPVAVSKTEAQSPAPKSTPPKKLFWSAALDLAAEAGKDSESDLSHVPPVLRGLRKCEACGFPVSAGRVLCVECEEKKWRGQLRKPAGNGNAVSTRTAPPLAKEVGLATSTLVASAPSTPISVATGNSQKKTEVAPSPSAEKSEPVVQASAAQAVPELVLGAGMAPRQSWISSHKYIILAIVVAAAVVAIFLSR